MIRALFLDLDGTLFDRDAAHLRYCEDLMGRHPDVFRGADLATLAAPDRRTFARRVASTFPGLRMSPAALLADHAARFPMFIEPEPGVVQLATGWSDRHVTALVSNGSGRGQRAKLARLGLAGAFSHLFLSGECGVAKPGPGLFLRALAWAGCLPEAALFVGDDPVADIAGASALGMRTCWIARGRVYPEGLPKPSMTVAVVSELAGVWP